MIKTKEGANAFEHSLDHAVEFFSKAGSLFEKKSSFYSGEESALSLFQKTWIVDKELSMKLLLWLRDVRGGAGNRSGFKSCLHWLCNNDPDWIKINREWIPLVGRWDDIREAYNTPCQDVLVNYWARNILKGDVLAAKWADRKDIPLQKALELDEAGLRKLLSKIRKGHIVEYKMCSKLWNEIEYAHVPSVAMARYTKAFKKHDEARFENYKQLLKKGETKINADVLFPHDCVRTVRNGDSEIANAQFDALPNYMENTNERIIVLSDTSGSMDVIISGSVRAVDVSQGMALYCSAKIPKDNPFHKKFIGFCSEGTFKDWNGMNFSEAVCDGTIFNRAVGSTHIGRALDSILEQANFWHLTNEQIPTVLLIISDMQFHQGVQYHKDKSESNQHLDLWEQFGYNRPKIIYWNTAGYAGSPRIVSHTNIGLVSGFSPSILKAVFACNDFSPKGIMMQALEKYQISIPN